MIKHTDEFKREAVRTLAEQWVAARPGGIRFGRRQVDAAQVDFALPACCTGGSAAGRPGSRE